MTVSTPSAQPRLGLVHLIVCTGVVAGYFGITRKLQVDQATDPYEAALWTLWSIGAGVAICGVVLCFSRFVRRRLFLTNPGDWLWLIVGVAAVFRLAFQAAGPVQGNYGYHGAASLIGPVLVAALFAGAAMCTKIHHWRWFFALCIVLHVITPSLGALGIYQLVDIVSYSGTAFMLIGAVTVDLLRRRRYIWTHWVGVGLWPWFAAILLGWLLYFFFVIEPALDATSRAS